jgi:hypothetical protein
MAKSLLLAALLLGGAARTPLVAGSQEGHNRTGNKQESAQPLPPKQMKVWNEELNYFRYLQAKDLKNFMSLWDDNFVGWPDYSEHPLRKADIESGVAEEFRGAQAHARPIPLPKPESIVVLGDLAVTYYFWPEADESSPVKYRVTHTWRKGPKGWRIIGGMDCAAPCSSLGISHQLSTSPNSKLKTHGPEVMNLMLGTWAIKRQATVGPELSLGPEAIGVCIRAINKAARMGPIEGIYRSHLMAGYFLLLAAAFSQSFSLFSHARSCPSSAANPGMLLGSNWSEKREIVR